jgi:BlaI family penicillinase repressor
VNETKQNGRSPRRALLDLAPLELDCMNTLWPMGEGTVREIRDHLAERLPRAYTTIMTIMDRLARKGVVERRKVNRAYVYRPNLSAEQARAQALGQVLHDFFGGSKEALLAQLGTGLPESRAAGVVSGATVAPSSLSEAVPEHDKRADKPRL